MQEKEKIKDMKKIQNVSEKRKFNQKYMSFLSKQSFEKFVKDNKLDTTKSLYELYSSKINNISGSNPLLYSNQQLFLDLNTYQNSDFLLHLYRRNFTGVTNFISLILDKIINNFNLLPYSIKFFCKIISLMIEQKFPNISQSEKKIFLSKFFFGRLLSYFFIGVINFSN